MKQFREVWVADLGHPVRTMSSFSRAGDTCEVADPTSRLGFLVNCENAEDSNEENMLRVMSNEETAARVMKSVIKIADMSSKDELPNAQTTAARLKNATRMSYVNYEPKAQSKKSFWWWIESTFASSQSEVFFGFVIVFNSLVMAVEKQYEGLETAHLLPYENGRPASSIWPGAEDAFIVLEWVFGIIFTVELVGKMVVFKRKFFYELWNIFDFVVVGSWLFDATTHVKMEINPMMLRLARVFRMVRLLRLVRWIEAFSVLHLIIKAIRSSLSTLMWALILILLLITIVAMVVGSMISEYLRNPDEDLDERVLIYKRWGTFTRATVTMFEVTLANWGPPCWELINYVSEFWGIFFIVYKCCVGFACVQVILSVFIQQTFKIAALDEEIMIADKKTQGKAYLKNLGHLFDTLDEHGEGIVSKQVFEHMLQNKLTQTWFAAIGVDVADKEFFELMDTGKGYIDKSDFIRGIKSTAGLAKASDLYSISRDVAKVAEKLTTVESRLKHAIDILRSKKFGGDGTLGT